MVQDLRYFLSMGMLCSGLFTFLFGLALTAKIKSLAYFIVIQVISVSYVRPYVPSSSKILYYFNIDCVNKY